MEIRQNRNRRAETWAVHQEAEHRAAAEELTEQSAREERVGVDVKLDGEDWLYGQSSHQEVRQEVGSVSEWQRVVGSGSDG